MEYRSAQGSPKPNGSSRPPREERGGCQYKLRPRTRSTEGYSSKSVHARHVVKNEGPRLQADWEILGPFISEITCAMTDIERITDETLQVYEWCRDFGGVSQDEGEPADGLVKWLRRRLPGVNDTTILKIATVVGDEPPNKDVALLRRIVVDWLSQQAFKFSRKENRNGSSK